MLIRLRWVASGSDVSRTIVEVKTFKDYLMNNMLSEFRRVERTLQRLTIIAEQLNEGVALVDLNGIIHFANPAMVKMHGYLSGK
jgi:PAS domain-containing protein